MIDGDGHLIEYLPLLRDWMAEDAGEDVAKGFDLGVQGSALTRQIPHDKNRELVSSPSSWLGLPSCNTSDRPTAAAVSSQLDSMPSKVILPPMVPFRRIARARRPSY